ncbi:MAG: asparagine synthase-related protein [Candidatus Krumholzibacteria bacterium]|nr:asparagine synthase-related protein [Candidatus Krumholzibacteria bacterium]
MGRILGLVDWSGSLDAGALIETMRDRFPRPEGVPGGLRKSVKGAVALGLVSGGQSFASGLGEIDEARCVVSYCGFMSGIETVFRENDLDAGDDTCSNLAALYRARGIDFLKLLPGMFMIALYDVERGVLLLAGDRSGFFPLYYSNEPGRFAFASSIKPLVSLLASRRINRAAVVEHLVFDALYGSATFYDDIALLPFGAYLSVDLATRRIERGSYFRYEELFDPAEYRRNRGIDAPAELTRRLRNAVGRVIEGRDASTFGLSCGGGIDCSFIGGIFKELGSPIPIFCTHVAGGRLSEGDMAKAAADHLGVELHVSTHAAEDFYPGLFKSIVDFGQPIVHPNTAKFYTGVGQTLSLGRPNQVYGVASDLLFGGFGNVKSYYRYLRMRKLFGALPPKVRTVVGTAMAEPRVVNLERRIRNPLRTLAGIGMGNFERAAMQQGVESAYAAIEDPSERALKVLMLENLCDYQQHLLNRRSELAASLGLSLFFPFLDLEVVRFAVNLPAVFCVDWRTAKIVVRKAALPYLGSLLSARKKYGGEVPIDRWVRPLEFLLEDGFVRDTLRFDRAAMRRLLDERDKLLWNMIDLELWGRLCLLDADPERLLASLRERGIACSPLDSIGA